MPATARQGPRLRWKRQSWRRRSGAIIVVRYLTGDDPLQAAGAKTAIDGGNVFVGTTVLLECERVLRSVCGFDAQEVAAALRAFAGLPGVSVQAPVLTAEARGRAEKGMDFADALHLGAAARCEAMVTFDKRFMASAGEASVTVTDP